MKNKKILLSYSSKDKAFSDKLYEYLKEKKLEVVKDDKEMSQKETMLEAIPKDLETVTTLVLIVSEHSLASVWCAYETCIFLNRKRKFEDLLFIPVLVDDQERCPEYIACFRTVSAKLPGEFNGAFEEVYARIKSPRSYNQSSFVKGVISDPAEYSRFQGMIKDAVEEGVHDFENMLKDVVSSIQKQQHILTPQSIAIKEKNALSEIWVVTTHLYNDVIDESIQESVRENLKRGIHYKYFVENTELIRARKEVHDKLYYPWNGQIKFVALRQDQMILPFDELVLYDPLEVPRLRGYAQIRYPLRGVDEDDLFLKLSPTNASSISQSLKKIADQNGKSKSVKV